MTEIMFRGMGFFSALCKHVIQKAVETLSPCFLCAVVQFDNAPSLNNLKKLGFDAVTTKPYKEYTFTYLVKEI